MVLLLGGGGVSNPAYLNLLFNSLLLLWDWGEIVFLLLYTQKEKLLREVKNVLAQLWTP